MQWVDKIIALLNSRVVILMFSLILPAFAAVSINYRLGVFGFFAHRDLTKESLREAVFVRLRQLRDSTGPSPKIAINREFPKAGKREECTSLSTQFVGRYPMEFGLMRV